MSRFFKDYFQGWPLVGTATAALTTMTAIALYSASSDVEGARLVIRATARTSVLLFCAAFAASSLARLWKSPVSRWMLRNRRYLGFSFGVSHMIHYVAVAAYAILDREGFLAGEDPPGLEKLVPIVLLALMMATSFDRTAAMLGRRAWKALHWTGSYLFWVAFLAAFGGRAWGSAFYSAITAFILVAYLIRITSFVVTRSRRRRANA